MHMALTIDTLPNNTLLSFIQNALPKAHDIANDKARFSTDYFLQG